MTRSLKRSGATPTPQKSPSVQRMAAELIDRIDVYHAEKQDGVTTQHITIYYNYISAFSVLDRRKIPAAEIAIGPRERE